MPDIVLTLDAQQMRELVEAAAREGIPIEDIERFASRAFAEDIKRRYALPITMGNVVPFESLKTPEPEP